jgi:NADH-quinone oxidoreductase subunit E
MTQDHPTQDATVRVGGGEGAGAPGAEPNLALFQRIQAEIAKYPNRRSAIINALRLAQEEYGWLSPEAIGEVSRAIDLSPATCVAVASFYDMFFLQPVGTHIVEVCTNVSCALMGAGEVLQALEDELGIEDGGTTADGRITLRHVECMGACGWAPVVLVNERYQEHFRPEDAPGLVTELRNQPRVTPGSGH